MAKIYFTGRRVDSLGHVEEMVDQLLHPRQHSVLGRQDNFHVRHIDGSAGQLIQALVYYSHTLPHLLDPQQVTVVTVSFCPNGDVEIELIVNQIRPRSSQIELHTAATQVWSR